MGSQLHKSASFSPTHGSDSQVSFSIDPVAPQKPDDTNSLICNRGKVLEGVVMTTPRVTQGKLKSSLISKICSGTANNDDVQQKKDLAQDVELNGNGG